MRKSRLSKCPICHGEGTPAPYSDTGQFMIACRKNGCKSVIGRTYEDAVKLWNEPRFTDAKPA